MADRLTITQLIDKYIRGTLSAAENEAFLQLFTDKSLDPELEEYLWSSYQQISSTQVWPEEFRRAFSDRLAKNILAPAQNQSGGSIEQPVTTTPVHRIHFLRRGFVRYAAAFILLTGAAITAAVVLSDRKSSNSTVTGKYPTTAGADIAPGGEKALLILADGHTITLDSAANGQLANEGGVKIVKTANGKISYGHPELSSKDVMWNTVTTPKGGQYQVTLPDGTRAWLNASSTITFPTAFTGDKRQIKIKGEVYFEVFRNKQKPFLVDAGGRSMVEVLGTSFNINAYSDEADIKTTLLEGSVKVSVANQSVVLKPRQQSQIANDDRHALAVKYNIDTDQALAWKNGIFNFNGADLHTVMRQLERWYDITVQYKGSGSNIVFKGKMYRNVNLSDVLDMLKQMGVNFELEGKNLTVL